MPDKLSKLLEKLEAKFPEDQDVMAVMAEYEASYEPTDDEDMEMPEDMPMEDMEMGDEMPAEGEDMEAMDLDMLLEEDMAEDDEEEMPMPKKAKSRLQ